MAGVELHFEEAYNICVIPTEDPGLLQPAEVQQPAIEDLATKLFTTEIRVLSPMWAMRHASSSMMKNLMTGHGGMVALLLGKA